MTKEELIVALEKAEGPSLELDEQIARAVGWPTNGGANALHQWWISPVTKRGQLHPPLFTDSIDDALTLVPGYLSITLSSSSRDGSVATVGLYGAQHTTPAIALCIAALKAR